MMTEAGIRAEYLRLHDFLTRNFDSIETTAVSIERRILIACELPFVKGEFERKYGVKDCNLDVISFFFLYHFRRVFHEYT